MNTQDDLAKQRSNGPVCFEALAFEAWWASQNTGLGNAFKFTAWNGWLAGIQSERAALAETQVRPEKTSEPNVLNESPEEP